MSGGDTLDIEGLRSRYREEREKRLEAGGRDSYIYLEGDYADAFDADPWAATDGSREPVEREVEAVIAGGGLGGLIAGGSLARAGIDPKDLCIIERGSDFGGTWYWNRYPGLSCDTEAYVYLPFLEETGYIPREKYAKGPEILEHAQRIGRHFGLYEGALFQTNVRKAKWDEESRRWVIRTDRGDTVRARYLWLCGGGTNRPKLPGIPGILDFEGHTFHTMRWDYDYTGGDGYGNLEGLKDKRVGLIGTGASAIQAVPHVGAWAQEFYVFQRTPSAVAVRANRPTDPAWAEGLGAGWQMERMENFLNIVSGTPQKVDLVDDAWTWNFKNVMRIFEKDKTRKPAKDVQERADFERMEQIRQRIDETVIRPEVADALKPWYGLLCKRPTFHDEYLKTFNRPTVHLVDTEGRGVERITKKGLVANGEEYELDCIIFATGFDVSSGMIKGMGLNPLGAGGETLAQRWIREFTTLHGIMVSGFPNLFVIGGAQGTLATTLTYGLLVQSAHCARIMQAVAEKGGTRVEARPEAERAWKRELDEAMVDHLDYFQACTPGYYNGEGDGRPVWNFYYGKGPVGYREALDDWWDRDIADEVEIA